MSSVISAIKDFLSVALLGGTIIFFVNELRVEVARKALTGSTKLSSYSKKLTGSTLDLSNARVYGK